MASLIAPDNHVPKEDAEALYKACKGTSISFPTVMLLSFIYFMSLIYARQNFCKRSRRKRKENSFNGTKCISVLLNSI